ncbi:MAG: hypothetical protein QOG72_2931 [Sphingomonadales bacterium]|jgi:hypothetical protein|nr:hypothetical protein [Sphingomonadales bacterium]
MNLLQRSLGAFVLAPALVAAAPAQMTPAEQVQVQAAIDRGRLLFELDQAAWMTTDDMLARLGGRRDVPIKGWVIERTANGDGYVVTYFGDGGDDDDTGPAAFYSGVVRGGKVVSGELFAEGARPPLTAAQLRLKQATDAARAFSEYQPCTPNRFNVAVVPPAAGEPIDAYLLSSQTERNVYPLGGHFRLRIDGGKIVSHRPFMKSCMNLNTAAAAGKGSPEALVVAHLLDPTPTEIHVFVSMWMKKPIFVVTGKRLWAVEGPHIRLVGKK